MASPRPPKSNPAFEQSLVELRAIADGNAPPLRSANGKGGAAAAAGGDDDDTTWEVGSVVKRERSIYEHWTDTKRYVLLALMSFATFLVPFSDTVYLPAMNVIQKDLNTTQTLMASTVAVYMFVVGVSALFWGPFADRYGRRITLLISSALFTGVSMGCLFSINVEMLIAFRALQGAAVSAMMVAANAVLADSWEPAQRGKALGLFMIPTLVGPIVGPLLGGGLSQGLGWRSCFAAMAICGGAIFLALLFFMQETHHHHVLKRIRTTEGDLAAASIKELPQIPKPVFRPPWQPLRYLVEAAIAPHAAVMFLLYATMFSALIILPVALAHEPYNLTEALIGVANLPLGLGCFIVGPFGGRWADAGARRWNASPAGRMVPGTISALLLFPPSTLIYAWALYRKWHLAVPMVASFIMGASICAYFPGVMSYVSILKQHAAAAAGGALQAIMFITGGVFIQITPPAMAALGLGWWVTLMVGVCFLGALISGLLTWRLLAQGAAAREQLPVASAGGNGDGSNGNSGIGNGNSMPATAAPRKAAAPPADVSRLGEEGDDVAAAAAHDSFPRQQVDFYAAPAQPVRAVEGYAAAPAPVVAKAYNAQAPAPAADACYAVPPFVAAAAPDFYTAAPAAAEAAPSPEPAPVAAVHMPATTSPVPAPPPVAAANPAAAAAAANIDVVSPRRAFPPAAFTATAADAPPPRRAFPPAAAAVDLAPPRRAYPPASSVPAAVATGQRPSYPPASTAVASVAALRGPIHPSFPIRQQSSGDMDAHQGRM